MVTHPISEIFRALFASERGRLGCFTLAEGEQDFGDTFANVVQHVFSRFSEVDSFTSMRCVRVSAAFVKNVYVQVGL